MILNLYVNNFSLILPLIISCLSNISFFSCREGLVLTSWKQYNKISLQACVQYSLIGLLRFALLNFNCIFKHPGFCWTTWTKSSLRTLNLGFWGIQIASKHSLPRCISHRLVSLQKSHWETEASATWHHLHANCFVSSLDLLFSIMLFLRRHYIISLFHRQWMFIQERVQTKIIFQIIICVWHLHLIILICLFSYVVEGSTKKLTPLVLKTSASSQRTHTQKRRYVLLFQDEWLTLKWLILKYREKHTTKMPIWI
jgi:hypothetical protein